MENEYLKLPIYIISCKFGYYLSIVLKYILEKEKYKVIIGHWSTIGFQNKKNFISIDTGCVWGNKLTAIEIISKDKIKKYQIKC